MTYAGAYILALAPGGGEFLPKQGRICRRKEKKKKGGGKGEKGEKKKYILKGGNYPNLFSVYKYLFTME